MATPIDVAGVAGTWVGAGVGVIALFALLGPFIIWRASKTVHHKALNKIGLDNNDYISPGWHLGPNIHLWRRVRAPQLETMGKGRPFSGPVGIDKSKLKDLNTKTTWVHLGMLIEAYGVSIPRGDHIVIEEEDVYLPVHPGWLLAIGLLGRYSIQAATWRQRSRGAPLLRLTRSRNVRPPTSLEDDPFRLVHYGLQPSYYLDMSGLTGTFKPSGLSQGDRGSFGDSAARRILRFEPHPAIEIQTVAPEVLEPKELFLLSLGILRLDREDYVSLTQISSKHTTNREQDWDEESLSSTQVAQPGTRPPAPPPVPWFHNFPPHQPHSDSSDDDSLHVHGRQRADNIFELRIVEADETIIDLGQPFVDFRSISINGFVNYSLPRSKHPSEEFRKHTYVPAESNWIRFQDYAGGDCYMTRTEAQQVALALLKVHWHPEGYLIGKSQKGACLALLTNHSQRLPGFVARVLDKHHLLSLDESYKHKLKEALGRANLSISNSEHSVQNPHLFKSLHNLDQALKDFAVDANHVLVDRIIGILALTNKEFLELVYQPLRNLKDNIHATIRLDLGSTTLKVPSGFGVIQDFPVDWNKISPKDDRSHDTVELSYTTVVLAVLKSLVCGKMLDCCFDAGPLLNLVQKCGEVAYVS